MDYETMGEELLGDDVLGDDDDFATVGAIRRLKLPARRGAMLRLPARPAWRNQIAPGVAQPGQGLELLPLRPSTNNGVFTNVVTAIDFEARPQAPFRAERLITRVARTGAAGILILSNGIFVGRQLQLVERGSFDVEFFGPTAFGVRLNLVASEPGVLIALPCVPSAAIAAGDSVTLSMVFLGRTIR